MQTLATLWEFNTARFRVVCTAEEENYPYMALGDDEDEILEKIADGTYSIFCAKVAVYLDGNEVAADYLGECVYVDPDEFATAHRDPDPMNRNCSVMRAARGGIVICHYFPDMVRQAIGEARKALCNVPSLRCAELT